MRTVATSILAELPLGISQMKLSDPSGPRSGTSCHALTSWPAFFAVDTNYKTGRLVQAAMACPPICVFAEEVAIARCRTCCKCTYHRV